MKLSTIALGVLGFTLGWVGMELMTQLSVLMEVS